jgi:hypothetical protein
LSVEKGFGGGIGGGKGESNILVPLGSARGFGLRSGPSTLLGAKW